MFNFWKKKKCKHEWRFIKTTDITTCIGGTVDTLDGCWIVCVHCEQERVVEIEDWERIEKRQQILKQHREEQEKILECSMCSLRDR